MDPEPVTVALVCLADRYGNTSAAIQTQRIVNMLAPTHILVLGTAGGISRHEKLSLGSVVIPGVIRSGPFNAMRQRELPTIPPSHELYDFIWTIENDFDWRKYIGIEPPEPLLQPPQSFFGELVSTDQTLQGLGNPVFREILNDYPRLSAVEMELGGVAYCLSNPVNFEGAGTTPSFLAIKGITEILYNSDDHQDTQKIAHDWMKQYLGDKSLDPNIRSDLENSLAIGLAVPAEDEEERNKEQRKKWSPYASHVSAALARCLIENYAIVRTPTQYKRIWKESTRDGLRIFRNSIGILTKIDAVIYSELATELLARSEADFDGGIHFFTVCAFAPSELYRMASSRYRREHNGRSLDDPVQLGRWAKEKYKHFQEFARHASRYPEKCARILLVDDDRDEIPESDDRENEKHLALFIELNGEVPCWKLDRADIRDTHFLTDYVIIGENVLLDYYHDSEILHIGDLVGQRESQYFTELFEYFMNDDKGEGSFFKPFLSFEPWYKKHS